MIQDTTPNDLLPVLGSLASTLRARPADAAGELALGHAMVAGGSWRDAVIAFRDAISMAPHNPAAYLGLGLAYLYDDEPALAAHSYQEALVLLWQQDEPQVRRTALVGFSVALAELGRHAEARDCALVALTLTPEHEELLRFVRGLDQSAVD